MNLTRCANGHFYDGDAYPSCPHCGGGDAGNVTVSYDAGATQSAPVATPPAGQAPQEVGATMPAEAFLPTASVPLTPIQPVSQTAPASTAADEGKTVSFWQIPTGENEAPKFTEAPVVGWLICTKGKAYGKDYRLKSGRNFIGRGNDMDVVLAGENTVSRSCHATVIHEPRKNIFIAQPGESRELFYVNGDVVLSSIEIKKNDVLQIGDVQLMLIPCCDDSFRWDM